VTNGLQNEPEKATRVAQNVSVEEAGRACSSDPLPVKLLPFHLTYFPLQVGGARHDANQVPWTATSARPALTAISSVAVNPKNSAKMRVMVLKVSTTVVVGSRSHNHKIG